MRINRDQFAKEFNVERFPRWNCPSEECPRGVLQLVPESSLSEPSAFTIANRGEDWFEAENHLGRFSARFKCRDCGESIILAGDQVHYEFFDQENYEYSLETYVRPRFFHPALRIIPIPVECPADVGASVELAFSLYWTSPAAAGNAVRVAAEQLLTHQGIDRYRKNGSGEAVSIFLKDRLKEYKDKAPAIHDLLDAIRWLGNSGSHGDDLQNTDVLDALEIFAEALDRLYPIRGPWAERRAQEIIENKGPRPKESPL